MQPIDQETISMACSTADPERAEVLAGQLQQGGYTITAARVVALGSVHNVCFHLFNGTEEDLEAVYQICRQALDLPPSPTKYQRLIAARQALEGAGYTVEHFSGWFVVRQAGRWAASLDTIEQLEGFVGEHRNDAPQTPQGFLKPSEGEPGETHV